MGWFATNTAFATEPDPAAVRALVPELLPVAAEACAGVAQRTDMSSHEIDRAAMTALAKIDDLGVDASSIDAVLSALQTDIGDIKALPLLRMQFVLGHLSGLKGDVQQQTWHRAYALALTQAMEAQGQGQDMAHAIRPCLIANEYDWLHLRAGYEDIVSQGLVSEHGQHYDVMTVQGPGNGQVKFYFDISDMMQQGHDMPEATAPN